MARGFLRLFEVLTEIYLAGVNWQPRAEMEANTAALLPALLLGRIDGKSPIEYVTEAREKDQVRTFARRFIATRTDRLSDIREAWTPGDYGMSASDIVSVHGRRVWDSRGKPTVEAEVRLSGGARGRAIAPAGASTGSGEAVDLRDGGGRFGGADVMNAVANVNGEIAKALAGRDARDQAGVDAALIALDGTPNKTRLGGNATVATSMAVLHAAAAAAGQPLYAYLRATSRR